MIIIVVAAIAAGVGSTFYGVVRARRFVASCQGVNPTIRCYGSIYSPGKLLRLKPVSLQINGKVLQMTDVRSGQTTIIRLLDSTISQGGKVNWMRVVLKQGDTSYWLCPFSNLDIYGIRGGILYIQKAYLPARNALTRVLTEHGAKLTADSVT